MPILRKGDRVSPRVNGFFPASFIWATCGIGGAQVLLREELSQGTETISKTLGTCWGLSRSWRTQGTGLAFPNQGQPFGARGVRGKGEVLVSGGRCSLSPMERMGSGPWELKASVPEKDIEEVAQRTGWDPEE